MKWPAQTTVISRTSDAADPPRVSASSAAGDELTRGSAVQELLHACGDAGRIEAVLGVEPLGIAGLAEPVDAEPLDRCRQHVGEEFGDGPAQPADDRVILDRRDVA